MKMAKKILGFALAIAMVFTCLGTIIASAESSIAFTEGFEGTTAATGGIISADMARTGAGSYCLTEDGTEPKLEIPLTTLTSDWAGKMMVAEAWYHIEGTLAGITKDESGTIVSGEKVTMAYYKDSESVGFFKGVVGTIYEFKNELYPNTTTAGWYRIRAAGIPQSTDNFENHKLVIGLAGAAEGIKLYVDDVKLFVTDNIVDMSTKGNGDFDTYDASGINGWTFWNCNGRDADYGTIEYCKDYSTSGEYSLKYTRKTGGNFGVIFDLRLPDFGATGGSTVVTNVNTKAVRLSGNFTTTAFQAFHASLAVSCAGYAETNFKTSFSALQAVPQSNNANSVYLRRTDASTATDNYMYFDDMCIKVVNAAGFAGLKTSVTGLNAQNKCIDVKNLTNGATFFPYAYLASARTTPTSLIVARYTIVNDLKILDNVSVQAFGSYTASAFDTGTSLTTTSITVPASGQYIYKVMTWDELSNVAPITNVTTYEVQ